MSQRQTIIGRRSTMAWFAITLVLILAIITVAVIFIVAPQQRLQQQAQATVAARQVELEQAYGAGVAFEDAGDWEAAAEQFKLVIGLDANHKDASTRLTEVRNRLMSVQGTATAVAVAIAQKTEADAVATAQIAPTATQQALEAQYEKALGYINIGHWFEAQEAFTQVFEVDPNYKEVQYKLVKVEEEIAKLTPTATATARVTSTPTPALNVIDIWSTNGWQDTGIVLSNGESFVINATGLWSHGLGDSVAPNPYGPDGSNKHDAAIIIPHAPVGVLIGRVGNGTPFVVGSKLESVAKSGGSLQLRMNDREGQFSNNSGHLMVSLRVK